MEAQLALDGVSADSPVGADEARAEEKTTKQQGGRAKDALCAVACANTPSNAPRASSLSSKERIGAGMGQDHSQLPSNWCEFAGLDSADFPTVPEPSFPLMEARFTAFHLTSPQDCRVVIVGQDPYHGVGQAQGLAFSVPLSLRAPPSLKNILKELASELDSSTLRSHDLSNWATNGVLLINAILSVAPGSPASHRMLGWQSVTSRIVSALGNDDVPRVFMLWGAEAMNLRTQIDEGKHLVLASSHPSPMGNACRRPSGDAPAFFGSRPFSRANEWLQAQGRDSIEWA